MVSNAALSWIGSPHSSHSGRASGRLPSSIVARTPTDDASAITETKVHYPSSPGASPSQGRRTMVALAEMRHAGSLENPKVLAQSARHAPCGLQRGPRRRGNDAGLQPMQRLSPRPSAPGGQPMPVISSPVSASPAACACLISGGQRGRPFFPGKHAASVQRHRHGESLRLPRFAECRSLPIARNARHCGCCRYSCLRSSAICSLQIAVPRIDRNRHVGLAVPAPQLPAIEFDRIEPLRVFALTDGTAVGKDMSAMKQFDYADMTANIMRKPVCESAD